ncbi:hypothetical protein CF327_g603 [Tilletia walkeri]|nr:hypothetical protein CF327_g603 [Tilletia walkeri]
MSKTQAKGGRQPNMGIVFVLESPVAHGRVAPFTLANPSPAKRKVDCCAGTDAGLYPTIPAAITDEALLLLRPLQAGSRDSPPDLASQSAPADLESTIERLERGYTEIKSAQVRPMIDLLHIFSLQRQSKVDTAHGGQPNAARDFEHSKLEVRFRNGGMFSQHVPALSSQTVALPGHFDGRHGHSKMAVFLKHAPMVSTGPRALRAMMRTKTAAMALG